MAGRNSPRHNATEEKKTIVSSPGPGAAGPAPC
nr:MAG TPA: hypothetical protein [Caudoviricetes sp.]